MQWDKGLDVFKNNFPDSFLESHVMDNRNTIENKTYHDFLQVECMQAVVEYSIIEMNKGMHTSFIMYITSTIR